MLVISFCVLSLYFVIRTYPLWFCRCSTSSFAELSYFWGIFFYYGRAKQTATSTCSSHVMEKTICAIQCTSSPGTPPATPSSRRTKRSLLFFLRVSEEAQQGILSDISIRNRVSWLSGIM